MEDKPIDDFEALIDFIEEKVGEAYEVGHAHGTNALKMSLNWEPIMLNEGWGKPFDEIKNKITEYVDVLKTKK